MSHNIRDRAGARLRLVLTVAVLGVMCAAAAVVAVLGSDNLERIQLVDSRLRDTGRFAEARARLQRRALEMLPATLRGDDVLVGDLLLQLRQAGRLGDRLPDDVRATLQRLELTLESPVVLRNDLVVAATLLEGIVDAESVVQERIFADAGQDILRERNVTLAGLVVLTVLALVGVWTVPRDAAGPFRPLMRTWIRGILDQRKALLRAERLALAGEAAASLAHEIRNPLAGVAMGLQNLERDAQELGPRIRPMVSELERITRTLNEHLGALRAPAEEPVEVDVSRLVTDMAELLRYEAADAVQVETSVASDLRCRTQQDRLRQVLLNLALNGLQALDAQGKGTLRIEAARTEGGIALTVRDNGTGFPDPVLQGVAGPFSSSRPGGTGLGLRLVRRMVGEVGGVLELSNPEEGGAVARVSIPCARKTT